MRTNSRLVRTTLAAAAGVMLMTVAPLGAERGCATSVYTGFDSRLTVDIAGKVAAGEKAVGFEVAGNRMVVAYPHRLVGIEGTRIVSEPSLDLIASIGVDRRGGVWLQSAGSVKQLSEGKMIDRGKLPLRATLHNSGTDLFMVTAGDGKRSGILFRSASGASSTALPVAGSVRAASWNQFGMAAIVDDALVVWAPGEASVRRLMVDAGLRSAVDVALIAPDRVVVSMPTLTLLVTEKTRLVLGAAGGRTRWANGALFLLEERSGIVWKLTGLESVGTPDLDLAHARRLRASVKRGDNGPAFLESVRIAGCDLEPRRGGK